MHPQVIKNFETIHRSDLDKINSLLDGLGIPAEYRYKNLSSLDRKNLIELGNNIVSEISKKCQSLETLKSNLASCNYLSNIPRYLQQMVIDPKDTLVPFSWVEPNSHERINLEKDVFGRLPKENQKAIGLESADSLYRAYATQIGKLSQNVQHRDIGLKQKFLEQEEKWVRKNITFEDKDIEKYFFENFRALRNY